MMVNEMVYLLFVVLVGLFGCCCVCCFEDVVEVLAVGKIGVYAVVNYELNASYSGDVVANFYVAEDVEVVAVDVGLCYEGNKMTKLKKDYLKSLRNYLNSTKILMNSKNFQPSLIRCDVDHIHCCYQHVSHYCVPNGGVETF
jgi:hypothetical protein